MTNTTNMSDDPYQGEDVQSSFEEKEKTKGKVNSSTEVIQSLQEIGNIQQNNEKVIDELEDQGKLKGEKESQQGGEEYEDEEPRQGP